MRKLLVSLITFFVVSTAYGDVFKCVTSAGVTYSELPCSEDKKKLLAKNEPRQESQESVVKEMKDHKGWINVDQFKLDLREVVALPTGDYECDGREGDGEEGDSIPFQSKAERIAFELAQKQAEKEMELQVKQCAEASRRESEAYAHARQAFNKVWLPALKNAIALGDPVAEVILRACETTSVLDREGVVSDCSQAEGDRKQAQLRLESIGFKPALHKYIRTADSDASLHCSSGDMGCYTEFEIARHHRILDIMRTGYVGVAEDYNTCQLHSTNEELDRREEECQRLGWLMRVVNVKTDRGYRLSLDHPGNVSGRHLNYIPGHLTRLYRIGFKDVEFRDPDFQSKFWKEVEAFLSEIKENIQKDLQKDPRWGVFLSN
ncbi:MAG: hypothetical protein Q7U91_01655 [Sideroxyarcus sp.]|nr:hypothetical protein [Sideroxyarcus sp.]